MDDITRPIERLDIPYSNLILTGFLGVGKSTVARHIALRLELDYFDIDDEIEILEGMALSVVRQVMGDAHLKKREHELCRRASLMRRAIIVVPGAALLDERNYNLLRETGHVVVLTCEMGEALRRLHLENADNFRSAEARGRMVSRIRREYGITNDARLLQLDTTHLTIEEETDLLLALWRTGQAENPLFRRGPAPPAIKPPEKQILGISRGKQAGYGSQSTR